jgi:hypothetical protein
VSNSQARHAAILREAADVFAMKNASYQDSWRDQGWRGNVSRVLEKAKRIRSLLWRQSVLLNGSKEHPRETLLDIVNTCVFAIINMDDGVEWGEGVDAKPIGEPYDHELEQFRLAHGNPLLTRAHMEALWSAHKQAPEGSAPAMARVVADDVTLTDIPVPGEEQPTPSPTPRRKAGQGSGPRRVTERQS